MFYNPYTNSQFGEYSVPNPGVPYDGEIPGGFNPGNSAVIRGYIPGHSQSFEFNFYTYNGDNAFHLNPRFHQDAVVRNTNQGGWGEEERFGPFVFRQSEPFELVVTSTHTGYSVVANGQHICDYNHRIPVHEVNRLGIEGDIEVHSISFQGGSQPKRNEVYDPPVPSSVALYGGCQPGQLIQIQGYVPDDAGRFEINLQGGPDEQPDNIALHFNPRWDDPNQPYEPLVVRTHRLYGNWGDEDRYGPPFPFQKGCNFEILILNENNEWRVAVNGQHYVEYPQRFECGMVDHVAFAGDIVVTSVKQFG